MTTEILLATNPDNPQIIGSISKPAEVELSAAIVNVCDVLATSTWIRITPAAAGFAGGQSLKVKLTLPLVINVW